MVQKGNYDYGQHPRGSSWREMPQSGEETQAEKYTDCTLFCLNLYTFCTSKRKHQVWLVALVVTVFSTVSHYLSVLFCVMKKLRVSKTDLSSQQSQELAYRGRSGAEVTPLPRAGEPDSELQGGILIFSRSSFV